MGFIIDYVEMLPIKQLVFPMVQSSLEIVRYFCYVIENLEKISLLDR